MRTLLLASLLAVFATPAFADLQDGDVLTHRVTDVSVNSVTNAALTADRTEVSTTPNGQFASVRIALELDVNVEGNLCGGVADDVALVMTRVDDTTEQLTLLRKYDTDPFSPIFSACAAYSAPRNVKLAFEIYGFLSGTERLERTYVIALDRWSTPNTEARVTVTYTIVDGFRVVTN